MEHQAEHVAGFDNPRTTKSTSRKVANAAHEAIDEGAERAEKLERKVRSKAEEAGEQVEKLERKLRHKAEEAGERVEATQAAAAKKIEHSIDRLEAFVKERPIAAAGIAFAAGVLATVIIRR